MSDHAVQHRRTHNLLLIQKLLSLREGSSPFTLILDTVEQSARPIVERYIHNATSYQINIVYVSPESSQLPENITTFILARRKGPDELQKEIQAACSSSKKSLLIISPLTHLLLSAAYNLYLSPFLSSLLSPTTTLLAIHHTDIPLPTSTTSNQYAPSPLTLLSYLATTILKIHNPSHLRAAHLAASKSLPGPVFGLAEERSGIIIGIGANDSRGCVVEMDFRRKSGRGVEEWFWFPPPPPHSSGKITLMEDCEMFRHVGVDDGDDVGEKGTFELGLTAKQRRDREGVVLPFFDAQRGEGGVGGRILYDMGVEDDFDEEEDEI